MKKFYAFDVETYRIRAGLAFPKLVCLSFDDGESQGVLDRVDGLAWFWEQIRNPDVHLIAHNATYDCGVMCAEDAALIPFVIAAYRAGRIHCTKVRQKILDNAEGELKFIWNEETETWQGQSFKLDRLIYRHFDVFLPKSKTWRLHYSKLDGVPISEYPKEAYDYALLDSIWALRLFFKQEEIADGDEIVGAAHVTRTSFALGVMRSFGFRTDPEAVAELKAEISAEFELWIARAQELGVVRIPKTPKGKRSKDMSVIKGRIVELYTSFGLPVPLSESGKNVATDRETLAFGAHKNVPRTKAWIDETKGPEDKAWNVLCVDPALKAASEVARVGKLLTTYVPIIERGITHPITPDYNEMVESFRTSCARPNCQNFGRDGGIRACVTPRGAIEEIVVPDDYCLKPGESWA